MRALIRDITFFVTDLIKRKNLKASVVNCCKKFFHEKLPQTAYLGIIFFAYILGRIEIGAEDRKALFNDLEITIKKLNKNPILKDLCLRTLRVSKFISYSENRIYMEKYLKLLIESHYQRLINRIAHKIYYGDITWQELDMANVTDEIKEGFDFFETFYYLASRINRYTINRDRYNLLELELFTLCNFMQVRMQKLYIDKKQVESFFLIGNTFLLR